MHALTRALADRDGNASELSRVACAQHSTEWMTDRALSENGSDKMAVSFNSRVRTWPTLASSADPGFARSCRAARVRRGIDVGCHDMCASLLLVLTLDPKPDSPLHIARQRTKMPVHRWPAVVGKWPTAIPECSRVHSSPALTLTALINSRSACVITLHRNMRSRSLAAAKF